MASVEIGSSGRGKVKKKAAVDKLELSKRRRGVDARQLRKTKGLKGIKKQMKKKQQLGGVTAAWSSSSSRWPKWQKQQGQTARVLLLLLHFLFFFSFFLWFFSCQMKGASERGSVGFSTFYFLAIKNQAQPHHFKNLQIAPSLFIFSILKPIQTNRPSLWIPAISSEILQFGTKCNISDELERNLN